jgi:antitoxin CptB
MTDLSPAPTDLRIDERDLSKLKWRCRRGLLENDLFIARFFERYETGLTAGQGQALSELMSLSDNDLLDLHMGRKTLQEVDPTLASAEVFEVLNMLKEPSER